MIQQIRLVSIPQAIMKLSKMAKKEKLNPHASPLPLATPFAEYWMTLGIDKSV